MTLTAKESSLVQPGLRRLETGFALAAQVRVLDNILQGSDGLAPGRRYRGRALNPAMAQLVWDLCQKLPNSNASRKIRLNAFEFAALAFALRINTPPHKAGVSHFARKLENYRRRAVRASQQRVGKAEFQDASVTWRRFIAWMRFNLISLKIPEFGPHRRKKFWADQRNDLRLLIGATLENRCYGVLSESDMTRMVGLLTAEFRRGRHLLGLRALLTGDRQTSEDLLFKLLEKKLTLVRLPGAKIPLWEQIVERGEKIKAYQLRISLRPSEAPNTPDPLPGTRVQPIHLRLVSPVASPTIAPVAAPNARPQPSHSLSVGIAQWLLKEVEPQNRDSVIEQAKFLLQNNLCERKEHQTQADLPALIESSRPAFVDCEPILNPDYINFLVDWLLGWSSQLESDPNNLYSAFSFALGNARNLSEVPHFVR